MILNKKYNVLSIKPIYGDPEMIRVDNSSLPVGGTNGYDGDPSEDGCDSNWNWDGSD